MGVSIRKKEKRKMKKEDLAQGTRGHGGREEREEIYHGETRSFTEEEGKKREKRRKTSHRAHGEIFTTNNTNQHEQSVKLS